MIDPKCPIWKEGRGFCWAPSAAWGCSDGDLCVKCKAKPRMNEHVHVNFVKPSDMPNGSILLGPAPVVHTDRTCRFCGRKNVYRNKWREKEHMCSNNECWAKFLKELQMAV